MRLSAEARREVEALIEAAVARHGGGADAMAPSFVTMAADGTVGADFTGVIHSRGLVIPEAIVTPGFPNLVEWQRADGSIATQLYDLAAVQPGSGFVAQTQSPAGSIAELLLQAIDAPSAAPHARVYAQAQEAGGPVVKKLVVAGDGSSDFILDSLLTAIGDLIYASAAGAPARRAIGNAGEVLTVVGGVPAWQAPAGPSVIHAGAPKTAVNPTVDTAVWTQSIPGGSIGAAGVMRATFFMDINVATATTLTVRVKYGGVTIDTFPSSGNVTAGVVPFVVVLTFVNRNATNSNHGRSTLDGYTVAGATHLTAVQTIDTSVAQNLVVSAQIGTGNAGTVVTLHQGLVEFL